MTVSNPTTVRNFLIAILPFIGSSFLQSPVSTKLVPAPFSAIKFDPRNLILLQCCKRRLIGSDFYVKGASTGVHGRSAAITCVDADLVDAQFRRAIAKNNSAP
jgi:hypothetical protein